MSNTAMTTYRILGDKENLQRLKDGYEAAIAANTRRDVLFNKRKEELLKEYDQSEAIKIILKEGFHCPWGISLHSFCLSLGFPEGFIGKKAMRGDINSCELQDDTLIIDYDGAWNEQEDFRHLLEEFFDVTVLYTCVEPGCGIYTTNDGETAGRWCVDTEDDGMNWPLDDNTVMEKVGTCLNRTFSSVQEMKEAVDEHTKNSDVILSVNRFTLEC